MTDRVLTEKEIDSLAHLGEHGLGGLYGAEVRVLIASHRELQKRVTEYKERLSPRTAQSTTSVTMSDAIGARKPIDLIDTFGDRMLNGQTRQAELLRDDLIRHLLVARSELRQLVHILIFWGRSVGMCATIVQARAYR